MYEHGHDSTFINIVALTPGVVAESNRVFVQKWKYMINASFQNETVKLHWK